MAGVGEATAILAVAQFGISLSNSLISYIGEVQDAPFRIQRISNEVATTSERLREIGELVGKNQQTRIFSEEGISSAVRCSKECQTIIEELKAVLQKGGWQQKSSAFESDFIDTSLFSTLRWPFLKKSLEVPRAELQRIKIDLSLLFSAAMALGASTSSDKVRYSQEIPGLQRSRDWAASMADQVRQRARDPYVEYPQREKPRNAYWADNEPEMLEDFVLYQERRIREEEDKKIKERALLLQAEQEEKRRKEEEAKHDIELKAIEAYKMQQDELQNRSAEERAIFRNELLTLGLEADQIERVLSSSKFNFGGSGVGANMPTVRPINPRIDSGARISRTPSSSREESDVIIRNKGSSTRHGWVRRILPWRRRRQRIIYEERRREPSLDFLFSDGRKYRNTSIAIETWLLDFPSNTRTEIMPSAEWLERISRKQNRESNLWRCFAGLDFLWRNSILEFLKWRNDDDAFNWSLYYIKMPQRSSRLTVSGHKRDNQLLQVIIFRREDPPEEKIDRRVSGESSSSERPQLKVSFAEEIMKNQNTKPTVISSHEPLRFRNKDQIKEAIKRLGAKKEKLDGAEPERIDEINDMILLLATQLQLHDTLSQSQRDILYGDSQYDEYPGINVEPGVGFQTKRSKRRESQSRMKSHATDRTEEIYTPRDERNRLLEETDDWDNMYSSTGGGELLIRQNSPKKSRSFERARPMERPSYTYPSLNGEAVAIRRQDRERHRDAGENSYEIPAQRERYLAPSRGQEIVIRRDVPEVPEYDRDELVIRDRERSPTDDMAISPKGYEHLALSQRPRQLNERLPEQHNGLEKLRLKEEILRLKEERAASNHDYATASDLAQNAIPEIQAQIRRLKAQDGRRYPNRQVSDYGLVEESRHPYRQRFSPIRRTSTFMEDSWPTAASKALVLRTGGSRQPDDYLRERILDRSIRIRGDPERSISPVRIIMAPPPPADSRQSSYSERDRRHVSRRPTLESELAFEERSSRAHRGYSHGRPRHRELERVKNRPWRSRPAFSSSEDDDYRPTRRRTASNQRSGPSNEEVITQTLKRFTTFQGDQPPAATQTSTVDTSSRQPTNAQNGDIPAETSPPLGLGTMSEEPGTMAEGTSLQSPIQAPSYPSVNGSLPQPGALPPPPPPRQHDPPQSTLNTAHAPTRHPHSLETNNPTKPPPSAAINGQPKATKDPPITEVSDESSEDGIPRLRKEDRKATVEDFEPDPGVVLYD